MPSQKQTNKQSQSVNVKVVVNGADPPKKKRRAPRKKQPTLADIPVANNIQVRAPDINITGFPVTPQVYRPSTTQIMPENPMNPPPYMQSHYTNQQATMNSLRDAMTQGLDEIREAMAAQATNAQHLANINAATASFQAAGDRQLADLAARGGEPSLTNTSQASYDLNTPRSSGQETTISELMQLYPQLREVASVPKSNLGRLIEEAGETPMTEEQKIRHMWASQMVGSSAIKDKLGAPLPPMGSEKGSDNGIGIGFGAGGGEDDSDRSDIFDSEFEGYDWGVVDDAVKSGYVNTRKPQKLVGEIEEDVLPDYTNDINEVIEKFKSIKNKQDRHIAMLAAAAKVNYYPNKNTSTVRIKNTVIRKMRSIMSGKSPIP